MKNYHIEIEVKPTKANLNPFDELTLPGNFIWFENSPKPLGMNVDATDRALQKLLLTLMPSALANSNEWKVWLKALIADNAIEENEKADALLCLMEKDIYGLINIIDPFRLTDVLLHGNTLHLVASHAKGTLDVINVSCFQGDIYFECHSNMLDISSGNGLVWNISENDSIEWKEWRYAKLQDSLTYLQSYLNGWVYDLFV